ncbi:Zinc finger BED domain-containing protein 4 [Chionoecetes opilio]|uniref:Zinc finger BED domain-containing protein 4 n=1 Tax=Chionoecetes opilio TaxID=41210 RepID=A0A8J8WFY5_CHIOP|nr:Zinc finger BED domain-containing protein 4 [Chionoecetes opilio]
MCVLVLALSLTPHPTLCVLVLAVPSPPIPPCRPPREDEDADAMPPPEEHCHQAVKRESAPHKRHLKRGPPGEDEDATPPAEENCQQPVKRHRGSCSESPPGHLKAVCHYQQAVAGPNKATPTLTSQPEKNPPDMHAMLDSPGVDAKQLSMNVLARNSSGGGGTKWESNDLRQKELTDCIVAFIAHDLLPVSLVDSEQFRTLMAAAQPMFRLPSRQQLSGVLLPRHSARVHTCLNIQLQQVHSLCLTVTLWSSKGRRSLIGVTSHFILDHTLRSVMLACRRLKHSHTSHTISELYQATVDRYDVASKVTAIVTDNAEWNVGTNAFPVEQPEDDDDDDDDCVDDDCDSLPPDDTTKFECLPPNRSACFGHSLQLVVKDGIEQEGQIKHILAKVSKLVSFCRKSTVAAQILSNDLKLQMATCTSWTSQLLLMRSVLEVAPEVWHKLDTPHTLRQHELNTIKDLCDIFEPFEYVANQLQGQNTVTSSLVVICVRGLRAALAGLREVHTHKLVSVLQSSTDTRLSKFESMEAFRLAATLDPRYKLDWCHDSEVQDMRDLLTLKYNNARSLQPAARDASPAGLPPMKRNKFFALVNRSSAPRPAPSEVSLYLTQPCLQEDCDPLGYWKAKQPEFPVLTRLAAKYLAMPATSAPVDQLFSLAGKLFRPDRCTLGDQRFEQLMMIRCNPQ